MTDPDWRLFVYVIDAIDDWTGWHKVVDARGDFGDESISEEHMLAGGEHRWGPRFGELMTRFREGAQIARTRVGWEGDVRGGMHSASGPFWVPIPTGDSCKTEFLIAWKQDNNGTTFVISPFALPWLEEA
jgi:hypothetical protein